MCVCVCGGQANEIAALEAQIASLEAEAVALKVTFDQAKAELAKLAAAEKNVKKARETAMKELEAAMKKSAKEATAARAGLTSFKNRRDALAAEVEALRRDVAALTEQLSIAGAAAERLAAEADAMEKKVDACKGKYEAAKAAKAEKEQAIADCTKEVKALKEAKNRAEREWEAATQNKLKVTHKLQEWLQKAKDAKKNMESLVKEAPWIKDVKHLFGVKGGDFDFEARDVDASHQRYEELKRTQDKLKKKIKPNVMGMLQKAEDDYNDLNKKRQIIVNDKTKIETVIEELDLKKAQALETTWTKVNKDFGSIFAMLLPGTVAKLEPPEGGTVMEGLEVKVRLRREKTHRCQSLRRLTHSWSDMYCCACPVQVAFNGVWKESLTELSGGQRSLLALSLILSLLLFKPAPMYILDEVDAALDLSHTQNIGMMLRTHFSASQFIVVSLKEGMFNNANVIFRTRFVDGVSAVTRTVVGSKNRQQALEDVEDENSAPQKKKSKAAGGRGRGAEIEA